MFYQIIQALFITHTRTKLNLLGHLDGMIVENNLLNVSSSESNTNWCQSLVRRPTAILHETRATTSYRINPHFQ
jgi:hypothetical protein